MSVNEYGWICPTISVPNRIYKKFRGIRRGLMVRMGDWSRKGKLKKCCREWGSETSRMGCGMKRGFGDPGSAAAETLKEVEPRMGGLGAETRECRAMRQAVELFLEWCGPQRINADREAWIAWLRERRAEMAVRQGRGMRGGSGCRQQL